MAGYLVKVVLEDTHPPVWRRVMLPERITFEDLHKVLQIVFEWEDYHLHEFRIPKICTVGDVRQADQDERTTVVDALIAGKSSIRYLYDFGDDWTHKILFEKKDDSYDQRYASLVKYKGDSFREDSGGVFSTEDNRRPPYDPAAINEKLKKRVFPLQNISEQEQILSNAQESLRQAQALLKLVKASTKKTSGNKASAKPIAPDPLEQKEHIWHQYCVGQGGAKDILHTRSRSSMEELMREASLQQLEKYSTFLGLPHTNKSQEEMAAACVACLKKKPAYLAYVFTYRQIELLSRVCHARAGSLTDLKDENVFSAAILLGLMDVKQESIGKKKLLSLQTASDLPELLDTYTAEEWRSICDERAARVLQCKNMLALYEVLSAKAFTALFKEYYGSKSGEQELLRAMYLGCVFTNWVRVSEHSRTTYFACLHEEKNYVMETMALIASLNTFSKDTAYKRYPQKYLERADRYRDIYPVWEDYARYVELVYALDEKQTAQWVREDYQYIRFGGIMDGLWNVMLENNIPEDTKDYIDLWFHILQLTMASDLPQYKGYSRIEFAKMQGISPIELPEFEEFRKQHPENMVISRDTHLYEFPLPLQYELFQAIIGEHPVHAFEKILRRNHIDNIEVDLQMAVMYQEGKYFREALDIAKKLIKERPEDEGIQEFLNELYDTVGTVQASKEKPSRTVFDKPEPEEYTIWDMIEGKAPKAPAETVRRETHKIGRNDPCPCGSGKKYKKCCGR